MRGRNNARAVKSATVVIFEDPKRRVVSLLNEAHNNDFDNLISRDNHISWIRLLDNKNYYEMSSSTWLQLASESDDNSPFARDIDVFKIKNKLFPS